MIKVGIVGATGYTGIELLRVLLSHPEVTITLVTSEKWAGQKIGSAIPSLREAPGLTLTSLAKADVAKACTVVFCCLPHGEAMDQIPKWLKKGTKVVDLSADFRLRSAKVYCEWYTTHTAPEFLKESVYGLPEIYRDQIKKAFLVANPGCYPTGAILALLPLIRKGAIAPDGIVIDSKSGVTGAGRSADLETLFSEVNESVHAYKIARHRHTPEIEQELSIAAGRDVRVTFTPHLVPLDRGILTTAYAKPLRKTNVGSLLKTFEEAYANEPFVRVYPEGVFPKTKEVRGTNNVAIGVALDSRTETVIVVSAIDNLGKGAATQAVQNMNLMYGLKETTGLQTPSLFP